MTRQAGQESKGGTQGTGGRPNGPRKTASGFSGGVCETCGTPLNGRGRGPGKRFCNDACRHRFHTEAFRVGQQVVRRRRVTRDRAPRPRMDAATRRTLVRLILAGSQTTGIPIPAQAPQWVTAEQDRIARRR